MKINTINNQMNFKGFENVVPYYTSLSDRMFFCGVSATLNNKNSNDLDAYQKVIGDTTKKDMQIGFLNYSICGHNCSTTVINDKLYSKKDSKAIEFMENSISRLLNAETKTTPSLVANIEKYAKETLLNFDYLKTTMTELGEKFVETPEIKLGDAQNSIKYLRYIFERLYK